MSVPVFTHAMNGMLTSDYTRSDLRKIATAQRPKAPTPSYAMAFNIEPTRGDLLEIQGYLAAEEAAARWKKDTNYGYAKPKSTEDLMRQFLTQMIETETARRAEIETAEDMPFAGVVARNIERKRKVAEATQPSARDVPPVPAAAPRRPEAPPATPALARLRDVIINRGGLDELRRMALAAERAETPLSAEARVAAAPGDEEAAAAVRRVFRQSSMADYFAGGGGGGTPGSGGKPKGPDRQEARWNSPPAAAAAAAPAVARGTRVTTRRTGK